MIHRSTFSPRNAIQQIKKKMFSPNPHTALYALMVLESVVKNCGAPIHEEISNKVNCESYQQLIQNTTHENVRTKMLELIQIWSNVLSQNHKYRGIKVNIAHTTHSRFGEELIIELVIASDFFVCVFEILTRISFVSLLGYYEHLENRGPQVSRDEERVGEVICIGCGSAVGRGRRLPPMQSSFLACSTKTSLQELWTGVLWSVLEQKLHPAPLRN